jgi:hypothetical protein
MVSQNFFEKLNHISIRCKKVNEALHNNSADFNFGQKNAEIELLIKELHDEKNKEDKANEEFGMLQAQFYLLLGQLKTTHISINIHQLSLNEKIVGNEERVHLGKMIKEADDAFIKGQGICEKPIFNQADGERFLFLSDISYARDLLRFVSRPFLFGQEGLYIIDQSENYLLTSFEWLSCLSMVPVEDAEIKEWFNEDVKDRINYLNDLFEFYKKQSAGDFGRLLFKIKKIKDLPEGIYNFADKKIVEIEKKFMSELLALDEMTGKICENIGLIGLDKNKAEIKLIIERLGSLKSGAGDDFGDGDLLFNAYLYHILGMAKKTEISLDGGMFFDEIVGDIEKSNKICNDLIKSREVPPLVILISAKNYFFLDEISVFLRDLKHDAHYYFDPENKYILKSLVYLSIVLDSSSEKEVFFVNEVKRCASMIFEYLKILFDRYEKNSSLELEKLLGEINKLAGHLPAEIESFVEKKCRDICPEILKQKKESRNLEQWIVIDFSGEKNACCSNIFDSTNQVALNNKSESIKKTKARGKKEPLELVPVGEGEIDNIAKEVEREIEKERVESERRKNNRKKGKNKNVKEDKNENHQEVIVKEKNWSANFNFSLRTEKSVIRTALDGDKKGKSKKYKKNKKEVRFGFSEVQNLAVVDQKKTAEIFCLDKDQYCKVDRPDLEIRYSMAFKLLKIINDKNYVAYIKGGLVRNVLLRKENDPYDIDLVVECSSEELKEYLGAMINNLEPIGEKCFLFEYEGLKYKFEKTPVDKYDQWTISSDDGDRNFITIDITCEDKFLKNGKKAIVDGDHIIQVPGLNKNAFIYDLFYMDKDLNIISPVPGAIDRFKKLEPNLPVGGVEKAEKVFRNDPLRMWLYVRKSIYDGIGFDGEVEAVAKKQGDLISGVAFGRLRAEFKKLFLRGNAQANMDKLLELGLLESVFSGVSLVMEDDYFKQWFYIELNILADSMPKNNFVCEQIFALCLTPSAYFSEKSSKAKNLAEDWSNRLKSNQKDIAVDKMTKFLEEFRQEFINKSSQALVCGST